MQKRTADEDGYGADWKLYLCLLVSCQDIMRGGEPYVPL